MVSDPTTPHHYRAHEGSAGRETFPARGESPHGPNGQAGRGAGGGRAPDPGNQPPAVEAGALSPERVTEVVERLVSGYYDTPEIIDELVRAVGDAVLSPDGA